MEFFRQIFFSVWSWIFCSFGLAFLATLLVGPSLPDAPPSNTSVYCLSTKATTEVEKETGFIKFICVREK